VGNGGSKAYLQFIIVRVIWGHLRLGRVWILPSCTQLYMFVQCLSRLLLFNTIGSSPAGSISKKTISILFNLRLSNSSQCFTWLAVMRPSWHY
jgi:hypothetical protein